MPFFKGEVKESPRKGFLYWSDDGDIFALRVGRWKTVFIEQNHEAWMSGGWDSKNSDCRRSSICLPTRSNAVTHPSFMTNGSSTMLT